MRVAKQLITSILTVLIATGCATNEKKIVVDESDPALKQLLELAKDIANYERQLYEIESARYIEVNESKLGSFDMHYLPSMEKY